MITITEELAYKTIDKLHDLMSSDWDRYTDNFLTHHTEESYYKLYHRISLSIIAELEAAINSEVKE